MEFLLVIIISFVLLDSVTSFEFLFNDAGVSLIQNNKTKK